MVCVYMCVNERTNDLCYFALAIATIVGKARYDKRGGPTQTYDMYIICYVEPVFRGSREIPPAARFASGLVAKTKSELQEGEEERRVSKFQPYF